MVIYGKCEKCGGETVENSCLNCAQQEIERLKGRLSDGKRLDEECVKMIAEKARLKGGEMWEKDRLALICELVMEERDELRTRVANVEKDVREYKDKVPIMLRILRGVRFFADTNDAIIAKQLIDFFDERQKETKGNRE